MLCTKTVNPQMIHYRDKCIFMSKWLLIDILYSPDNRCFVRTVFLPVIFGGNYVTFSKPLTTKYTL